MPHSSNCTCYICYICYCDCRWKKRSSKTGHRLRPPAEVVLNFHRGLCCQQLLGALHAAVECCKMQRSPTSAPAEWRSRLRDRRRSLSSPRVEPSRTSTAAPFATRNATTAGWSLPAAWCSADEGPKTRSRLSRSRRRWPRTAGRSPRYAAWTMSSSQRAEEWNRNDDVFFFFFPLIFLISLSYKSAKSATKFHWIS